MRILVVDDEARMAALLKRGLEEDGYVVDVAATGPDALRRALESNYDLVLMDLMLPGVNGTEVCRRLRTANRGMPIILLSACDSVADRVAGVDAGGDDYLVKPVSFDTLIARVSSLARGRAPTRLTEPLAATPQRPPPSRWTRWTAYMHRHAHSRSRA